MQVESAAAASAAGLTFTDSFRGFTVFETDERIIFDKFATTSLYTHAAYEVDGKPVCEASGGFGRRCL